jgi:tetratricopeptide (TPR) repeat protein
MYQPDYAEAWANKGAILHELKRHEEALSHFDKALMYQPDYAEGWVNKGIVLASHKQLEQALFCFQRALEFNPNFATAAHGILDYYSDKGMFTDALNYAEENYALLKDSKKSNELLAYLHLSNDDKENALQSFNKSFLIHRQSTPAENKDSFLISESLIKHEFEQLSFLKSKQLLSQDGNNALSIIEGVLKDPNKRIEELEKYKLLSALKSYHYLPDLPFPKKALGNNNYDHIESQYLNSDLKLAVIDNFLSEEALLNLRQFCEEANVWKTSFANGYVGSFIGSGFCSRALLAISEELKKMLPNIIGQNRLMQAWGFKYDQDMKGINLHADFAKINVNFWITPNDACMDLNSGGMVIYGTPVPETWGFDDYNCNPQKLREYLKFNNSTPVTVPYRMNRCVLFDSAYIHNTDHLSFKPGYENRRINCTLLYGRQLHL